MNIKKFIIFFIFISLCCSAFADDIKFSAGRTEMSMKGEQKQIKLSDGAKIDTGDVRIEAFDILIRGDNYSLIDCEKNVIINDFKHKISIYSTSLRYDRNTENIVIDGWVEMQDLNNEVAASASWLDFDMNKGVLKLQIRAKIIKNTSKGAMLCRADSIIFDRDNNTLLLSGNSKVKWDGDDYSAANIQVDLKTEEIKMVGDITGNISN